MLFLLFFLILLTLVSAGLVWLLETPGSVMIVWLGYEISLTIPALIFITTASIALVAILAYFFSWLIHSKYRVRTRRMKRAINSLSDGFVALAQQQPAAAIRHARKAEHLSGETPLSMMLNAYGLQQQGQHHKALPLFEKMLENSNTEMLGLKGLLQDAYERNDYAKALELALERYKKHKAPSLERIIMMLFKRTSQWDEGLRFLSAIKPNPWQRIVSPDSMNAIKDEQALLLFMKAMERKEKDDAGSVLPTLKEALNLRPTFIPLVVETIEQYKAADNLSAARKLLKQTWKKLPHPDLSRLFFDLYAKETPKKRLSYAEKIANSYAHHVESYLLVARAALDAEDISKARNFIKLAIARKPEQRLYDVWIEIENQEPDNSDAVEAVRLEQAAAVPNASWQCSNCHAKQIAWQLVCSQCDQVDSIEWNIKSSISHPQSDPFAYISS